MTKVYRDEEVRRAIDILLESEYWPDAVKSDELYQRRHDDTDGENNPSDLTQYLSLGIDNWGDVHINIPPGKWRELRFRTRQGGGQSERVRKALIILAEAIRRDNEKNPES
jgi:hypothetical protein